MSATTKSRILAFAAMLTPLVPAPSNAADTGSANVSQYYPLELVVKSNGASYTQIDETKNVTVLALLKYDTGGVGRVKSWWVEPKILYTYWVQRSVPGLDMYRKSKSYSFGHRPKTIEELVYFHIPIQLLEKPAVDMCNMQAELLRKQGKSNAQIFSQDHMVEFELSVNYDVDANGPGSNNPILEGAGFKALPVRCSKFTGPQIPTVGKKLTVPTMVLKATMQVKEIAPPSGVCRIDTVTAISANKANATIKYRFVHNSGKKSKVFTTKTKANKIAVVKHQWDIPNGPGMEYGWVRIEGVSPKFKSNKGSYFMNCYGKGPGGVSGEGGRPGPGGTLRQR